MARISDDDIRRVREATDLVSLVNERVVLTQKGRLFWGCCPFHDEKTPSFKIDPDLQNWHCFGCGKSGDVFGYLMESEHLEFPEAVRALADRANIEITEVGGSGVPRSIKERMMQACAEAEEFYHMELMRSRDAGPSQARAYLHDRGFGSECARGWHLGYAPGHGKLVAHLQLRGFTRDGIVGANLAYVNKGGRLVDRFFERVMFPVHDLQGRSIAFGGRIMGAGEPKYLNTSETPIFHKSSNMFGIDIAKSAIVSSGEAIVVEGYTDVIAMHQAGIANVVATLGTALTAQHVKLISRFATRIVYLFDGDAAGQKAADRASEFIDWQSAVESRRDPIDLRVAVLPDGKDPAEFLAAYDAAAMRDAIAAAEPLLAFSINRCIERYDLRRPENKARAMTGALQILYPIKDSVSATDYVNIIADRLNVEYTAVFKALKETKAPMAARHQNDQAVSEPQPNAVNPVAEQIIEADQQSARMEYGLIALVVTDAHLLDYIEKDLVRIRWMDQAAESMADALMTIDHEASAAQALASVQGACPDASTLLAQAMIETEDGEERLFQARLMIRTLRERDLERSIRDAKARMRTESGLSADELDRLFEQTVSMQKELVRLRSNAPDDLKD